MIIWRYHRSSWSFGGWNIEHWYLPNWYLEILNSFSNQLLNLSRLLLDSMILDMIFDTREQCWSSSLSKFALFTVQLNVFEGALVWNENTQISASSSVFATALAVTCRVASLSDNLLRGTDPGILGCGCCLPLMIQRSWVWIPQGADFLFLSYPFPHW